jgi:hypothetical protein
VVTRIEEMPDDRTDREHDGDNEPVEARGEQERVMIADHQEHDRQREIVVVDRARLAIRLQQGSGFSPQAAPRRSSSGSG